MSNDGIRRARPTIDSPLGDLIAGKITQAEYRRRMESKRLREDGALIGRLMTPPIHPKPYRLVPDSPRRGCSVIPWLALILTALVVGLGFVPRAAPRSSPESTLPVDVSGQWSTPATSGAPHESKGAEGPQPGVNVTGGAPQANAPLGGFATWYADPSQPADGLYAAAGPALRDALGNWRGTVVRVQAGRRWTSVTLSDACWCVDRRGRPTLLDVSPAAIAWLEPDYRRLGVVAVRVAWTAGGPLPATDGE